MGVHLAAEGFDIKRLAHAYQYIAANIANLVIVRYRMAEPD
jgi:hypothetical protein